jgi:hypothetical protein
MTAVTPITTTATITTTSQRMENWSAQKVKKPGLDR